MRNGLSECPTLVAMRFVYVVGMWTYHGSLPGMVRGYSTRSEDRCKPHCACDHLPKPAHRAIQQQDCKHAVHQHNNHTLQPHSLMLKGSATPAGAMARSAPAQRPPAICIICTQAHLYQHAVGRCGSMPARMPCIRCLTLCSSGFRSLRLARYAVLRPACHEVCAALTQCKAECDAEI